MNHGRSLYNNHGCRCDICRADNTAYVAELRERRSKQGLPPGDPRHGSPSSYTNYGCRCDACREANTRAKADRRRRLRGAA